MPTTTNKQVFDTVYSPFKTGFDWSNYIKNYDNKQYYVAVDLTPKVPTDRIPYWNFNRGWIENAKPDGYLPAGHSSFYFQMRPISLVSVNTQTWLKQLVLKSYPSTGFLHILDLFDHAKMVREVLEFRSTRVAAMVTIYTSQGYKNVVVPVTDVYFNARFYAFDSSIVEKAKPHIEALNNDFKNLVLGIEKLYNKAVVLQADKNFKNFTPAFQQKVLNAKNIAVSYLSQLQNSPDFVVKLCKECQKNARIGNPLVLPLVYTIGAVSLALIAKGIIDNFRKSREYIQVRKQEIDRELKALNNIEMAVRDPNLTQAQKDAIINANTGVIKDAQGNIDKADTDKQGEKGFFDRIENLMLMGGLFVILNNLTKKG